MAGGSGKTSRSGAPPSDPTAGTGTLDPSAAAASDDDSRRGDDGIDVAEGAGTGGAATVAAGGRRATGWRRHETALTVLGLTALLAVPLVVALAAQREPRWFPMTDMAEYELNVRDVFTAHPPLLGLPGRIFGYGTRGSHPGPVGFYLLAPVYWLLGGDGWSLQASTAVLVLAAVGLTVWVGHRRGGWSFALALTAVLALLLRGYGATVLLQTWNPHLPLLWWVLFLLAVWAVLCGDLVAVPVAALAGTFCVQTHISYIPLVGGLGLLAAGVLAARLGWARRDDPPAARRLLAWAGGTAVLGALLWLPPVIQQVTNTPGNFQVIRHNFTDPTDVQVSFGEAFTLWTEHFDVTTIAGADLKPLFPLVDLDTNWIGLAGLAVWAGAVALAWRHRAGVLLRLHLVAGVAAGLGLLGMSRIIGVPWPYLTYWAWGTTTVMLLATVWTYATVLLGRATATDGPNAAGEPGGSTIPAGSDAPAIPAGAETPGGSAIPAGPGGSVHRGLPVEPLPSRGLRPAGVVLGAATLLLVGLFALEAPDTEMDDPERSWTLAQVVGPTLDGLEADPACEGGCRVLVDWTDESDALGAQAMGLLVALERQGVDARMLPGMELHARGHRVTRRADADIEVHLAVDREAIADWRDRDGAREVASARPRDPVKAEPIAVFLVNPARPGAGGGQREATGRGL